METSITSEMISQQTICGDNESSNLINDMENSKEQTELKRMQNNLKKAREVYFKYISSENGSHKSHGMEEGYDGDDSDGPITDRKRCLEENGEERSQGEDSQNWYKEL